MRAGLRQSFFSEKDRRRAIKQKKNDVAVFLDIGGTLTYDNVHTAYAEALGYPEEERSLRQRLNSGGLSPEEFDREIANILVARKFSRQINEKVAAQVRVRPHAEKLLNIEGADIYIASMAPSFYVDWLIKKYKARPIHVLSSMFHFDESTGLFSGDVRTQNAEGKSAMAQFMAPSYSFSAGVGDNAKFDGPFLRHCTLGFIIQEAESGEFLYTNNLNKIYETINSASSAILDGCQRTSTKFRRLRHLTQISVAGNLVLGGVLFADRLMGFLGQP